MIIKLADKTIEVNNIHTAVETFCRDYIVDDRPGVATNHVESDVALTCTSALPDSRTAAPATLSTPAITITIAQSDIDFERQKAQTPGFSDDYLETLAVYRKIANELANYDTLLIHGSAIEVDGNAYLFTAKSGTGKSTHTRLWREEFGDRAKMINDDKPLLKIASKGATIYGSPWNGKHRLGENASAPLKAICILERGETNSIEKVSPRNAYPEILKQTHRPTSKEGLATVCSLLDKLLETTPVYRLKCNISREAVLTSYNGMKING